MTSDNYFDLLLDSILILNKENVLVDYNSTAPAFFGYTDEAFGQLQPEDLFVEWPGLKSLMCRIEQQEPALRLLALQKTGETFSVLLQLHPIQRQEEELYLLNMQSLDRWNLANSLIRDSQSRLKAIFESAVDGIITINEKGIIETINPAVMRLFQYKAQEIVGKNIRILMPEPHHTRHDVYINNYLRTGEQKIIGIGRIVEGRKRDGTIFPFRLSISEAHLGDKRIFTGVIHDMTRAIEAEEKIRRLNAQLEERVEERTEKLAEVVNRLLATNQQLEREVQERRSVEEALRESERELLRSLQKEKELNELKSRFVSTASHEFRTPLSTILSSASLISRYTDAEGQPRREKHIKRIKSAVNNLTGILNDFLSLSKLEEGRVEHDPCVFDWEEFSADLVEEIQPTLKKGQEILLHNKGNTKVCLDKPLLKNSLINLLSNASKYSAAGQNIQLNMYHEAGHIRFEVVDQGIGISPKDQEHLFTRFFRAENASNIQGTGLGLNIVQRYVQLMGGEIHFKSAEGEGSIFELRLPPRDGQTP